VTGLALCCIGLAGLYYFLNSPFLALMEILIYVGAVCVTIVFGVMLSETDEVLPERFKAQAVSDLRFPDRGRRGRRRFPRYRQTRPRHALAQLRHAGYG